MPLMKKIVPIPLGSIPMDSGSDPKIVQGITTVRNGAYDVNGRIIKRGYEMRTLDGYNSIPTVLLDRAALVGERMLVEDTEDQSLQSLGLYPTMGAGAAPLCDIGITRYENNIDGYYLYPQVLTNPVSDVMVLAWAEWKFTRGLFSDYWAWYYNLRTIDKGTGKTVDESTWLANTSEVKPPGLELVYLGPSIWCLYNDYATNTIAIVEIASDGTIGSVGHIPAMIFNLVPGTAIDARAYTNQRNIIGIGYISSDGVGDGYAEFCAWDVSITNGNWIIPQPADDKVTGVCVFEWDSTADYMLFAWTNTNGSGNTDVKAIGLDTSADVAMSNAGNPVTVVSFSGKPQIIMSGMQLSQGGTNYETGDIYLSLRTKSGQNEYGTSVERVSHNGSGTLSAPYMPFGLIRANNVVMVSRPWCSNDGKRQFVAATTGLDDYGPATYVVVRQDDVIIQYYGDQWPRSRVIGKCLQWRSNMDAYNGMAAYPNWVTDPDKYGTVTDGYSWDVALQRKASGDRWGLVVGSIVLQPSTQCETSGLDCASIRGMGLVPNSLPYVFDGRNITEQGFVSRPRYVTLLVNSSPGALSIGTYAYYVTWEWVDDSGNLWRSVPSDPHYITLSATADVSVTVPFAGVGNRSQHKVVVWRTAGNGQTAYRIAEQISDNFLSDATYYFVDKNADASILDNEALYTTGGVLEQYPPPQHRVMCIHQGRMFCADREEEETDIYYSHEFVPDFSVEMTSQLLKVPSEGGRIMALKSFMDRLVVFKERTIYAIYGTGPARTGANPGYYEPTKLSGQIGCEARHSVIETPDGLMFWSAQGIMLLDRSLQLKPIGEPVRYWTDGKTFGAAMALPEDVIALYCSTDGYGVAYNWRYGKWAVHDSATHVASCGVAAPDGRIILRDSTLHLRRSHAGVSNEQVNLMVDTGWISVGGIGGFQRLRNIMLLGQLVEHHKLRVEIAYDWDGYFSDVQEIDTYNAGYTPYDISAYFGNSDATLQDKAYMLRIAPRRQKCGAFRMRIMDEAGWKGKGFSLTTLALEIGVKEGRVRPAREVS
jgi:hypothetical protein